MIKNVRKHWRTKKIGMERNFESKKTDSGLYCTIAVNQKNLKK